MKTLSAKRFWAVLLAAVLLIGCLPAASFAAVSETKLQQAVEAAGEYMLKAVKDPQPGAVGG